MTQLALTRETDLRPTPSVTHGAARLFEADCFDWLAVQPENTIHGVVTDPPYGLVEYTAKEQKKLRKGRGGCLAHSAIL